MKRAIPKTYDSREYEDALYQKWEESGLFNPDICIQRGVAKENAPSFSIMLPPPNATGTLHIGHAVMLAIQDLVIRFHRMRGDRTLWLPGTDHAALATHEKVERLLWEEEKKTRHDLGREKFLQRIEEFVQKSRDIMCRQMRKMGSSLDWSREAYTLDEKRRQAVNEAFKRMYESGIISRGGRIVNWDPKMRTTVSDDEIDWKEETTPFYYLKYGPFTIGTSRPETKFGDKYVVVHPDDERYQHYENGQKLKDIEWINGTITATVIKDPSIDMSFGTGAMTITPWHDATDFDIAERHHLDKEQIIDYNGKLLGIAGEFAGMDIIEARTKIIEKLRAKGLVTKTDESYVHNIATNSRGGGIIEPQIRDQWFVNVNKEFERNGKQTTLKMLMQSAVRSESVRIIPERFEKIYFHWIDNLRDWCISRQIWFGHRIPMWYCEICSKVQMFAHSYSSRDNLEKKSEYEFERSWHERMSQETFCFFSADEPKSCPKCGDENIYQDPDTLDTWFSSGLWTFSALGWPKETSDLKIYHPTSVLESGSDILFFWIARMILMSTFLLDEIPFKTVYLHGLVRDEKGRKMSKSIGNVIDPLDIIPEYGTDAIRLSLVIGTTPGNDSRIGSEKISTFRNFTNKLWNIGRYVMQAEQADQETPLTAADHWIAHKLDTTAKQVTKLIESYQFSLAGETLRDFTWNDFADWYIEAHKIQRKSRLLEPAFGILLKLWHPFMPFVTEAIWQHFGANSLLLGQPWPEDTRSTLPGISDISASERISESFEAFVRNPIESIRAVRAAHHVPPSKKLNFIVRSTPELPFASPEDFLDENKELFLRLARLSDIRIDPKFSNENAFLISVGNFSGSLAFDLNSEELENKQASAKERIRLETEMQKTRSHIESISARLANPTFQEKAPKPLIQNTEKMLAESKARENTIRDALKSLID